MLIGKWFCKLAQRLGGCAHPPALPPDPLAEFMPADLPSSYPVYELPWGEVVKSLETLGLAALETGLPDRSFFYTDEETWGVLLPGLTYPGKYFKERERKDCDDYAKKASADSSFYFGLSCLQVRGQTPIGLHAFNMVLVSGSSLLKGAGRRYWKVFEPDASKACAGKLLDLDNEYGWNPSGWKT